MKIIVVRHGETKEGKKGIILGQLPGTLSSKGKLEAKKIADIIEKRKLKLSLIISSNLKRAKETAEIISKKLNLPIKYEKLVKERHAGIAQGKKEKEIDWENYEKKPLLHRKHAGGESFLDVGKRAKKFIIKIKKINKNILLVSHSVFILMLISEIYKISFEKTVKKYKKHNIFILDTKKRGSKNKPSLLRKIRHPFQCIYFYSFYSTSFIFFSTYFITPNFHKHQTTNPSAITVIHPTIAITFTAAFAKIFFIFISFLFRFSFKSTFFPSIF